MPVHIGTASLWATVAAHFIVFGIFLLAVWILCKKAVKENEPTPHLPFCLSMAVGLIILAYLAYFLNLMKQKMPATITTRPTTMPITTPVLLDSQVAANSWLSVTSAMSKVILLPSTLPPLD